MNLLTFARLALAALVLVLVPLPAAAQGLGAWVSPGPLATPHADLEGITLCSKCHAPGLGVTMSRCVACHDRVGEQVRTGQGFHGNKGDRCGTCHADHRGRDFQLVKLELSPADHLRETGFLLDGAHAQARCPECHEYGQWDKASPACESCHREPHGATEHIKLVPCDQCHNTSDWLVRSITRATFDHTDTKHTDYPLVGAHIDVSCADCHVDARFTPLDFEQCTDCHADVHLGRFKKRCEDCHIPESWWVKDFEHALTGYVLEGVHTNVGCKACHGSSIPHPVAHETCGDCHKDVHRKQFVPRDCDSCHTVTVPDWKIALYDHDKTDFPLLGKHETVACIDCHGSGVKATYRPVAHTDCDDCHDDIHAGKFEPTDCRACHTESGWAVGEFDHNRTDFPLLGKHTEAQCADCHPGEQWSGIAYDGCLSCHDEDQPHGGFFTIERCDGCHEETAFTTITFAHADETDFDLEPQHAELPCKDCHTALDAFDSAEVGCRSCHEDDTPQGHYDGACEDCHRQNAWLPADLGGRPHDITGYALTGTHAMLACEDCHGPARVPLAAAGDRCIDCHADDDAHRNLISRQCEDCHVTTSWLRTTFRHGTTGWPLRGAHRLAYCDDCHAVSYAGTPNDCWRCHEAEADRREPAHQSAFFRQCDLCHRPYTWGVLPSANTTATSARVREGGR